MSGCREQRKKKSQLSVLSARVLIGIGRGKDRFLIPKIFGFL
ncbi:MAG: hypothetical protein WC438_00085 [Candidatus Pacearchaeota archaeon]